MSRSLPLTCLRFTGTHQKMTQNKVVLLLVCECVRGPVLSTVCSASLKTHSLFVQLLLSAVQSRFTISFILLPAYFACVRFFLFSVYLLSSYILYSLPLFLPSCFCAQVPGCSACLAFDCPVFVSSSFCPASSCFCLTLRQNFMCPIFCKLPIESLAVLFLRLMDSCVARCGRDARARSAPHERWASAPVTLSTGLALSDKCKSGCNRIESVY